MLLWDVLLRPLAEQMQAAVPESLKPLFADDVTSAGQARYNAAVLEFLEKHGPPYGYFAEPDKFTYVCKGEDKAVA